MIKELSENCWPAGQADKVFNFFNFFNSFNVFALQRITSTNKRSKKRSKNVVINVVKCSKNVVKYYLLDLAVGPEILPFGN